MQEHWTRNVSHWGSSINPPQCRREKSSKVILSFSPNIANDFAAAVWAADAPVVYQTLKTTKETHFSSNLVGIFQPCMILEEKKAQVILCPTLRHFYFQPFRLQSRVNSPSPSATGRKRIDVLLFMPRARVDTWDWFGLWKQDRRWRSCFNDSEFIPDHILVYNWQLIVDIREYTIMTLPDPNGQWCV